MAQLAILTEKGMFHAACRCDWGNRVDWYGFKPKAHLAPAGPGYVDRSDRSKLVNHSITFEVDDARLHVGAISTTRKYDGTIDAVTIHDCVSFAADFSRSIGLNVPLVNITPFAIHRNIGALEQAFINDLISPAPGRGLCCRTIRRAPSRSAETGQVSAVRLAKRKAAPG